MLKNLDLTFFVRTFVYRKQSTKQHFQKVFLPFLPKKRKRFLFIVQLLIFRIMTKRSKNDEQITKLINVETKNNVNGKTANNSCNADKLEKKDTAHSVLSELIKVNQRIASVETLAKSLRMLESKGGDFAEYAQKVAEKLETDAQAQVTRWVQKEEKPQSYIKEDIESGYYLVNSDFDNPTTLYNNIKSHINYKSERDKVINRKATAELKENNISMAELLALAKANGLIK